ncbi:MAG TPA: PQQ-binding-like beta-propeller repeat protein [Gaiellaceae bacterium]|nr:PQQ-binding-like beta-propeller repeat protein [Gaiellaceae bacterium]
MKRLVFLFAAGAVLAGCGTAGRPHLLAPHMPVPVRRAPARHYVSRVAVTVLDGDTNRRVFGAVVSVGGRTARTNARGVAYVALKHRSALVTTAHKAKYSTRAVRLSFRTHPQSTLRIYRPALQWTMYGAQPQRTQAPPAIHVRPPFKVVWSRGLDSLVEFPAVVQDGVAYVSNAQGTIWALDMRTGAVIWRHVTPHGKMAASPAVWRDQLVVHGMDGHVWVLRRSDGRLLWHYDVGSPVESSPVVENGVDVFGAWNGVVTALNLRTRHVQWTHVDGCKVTSSVAVAGSTLYLGDYCGRLEALSRTTGALRWSGGVNGRVYGTPAVAGGRVFVPSSTGGSLTAFSTRGSYLWSRSVGSYVYSSPAAWGGRVFFGAYNGVFYALDARTGATRWTVGAGGAISGAAVVVDGVAYAGSFAHRIVGVDARTGRVVLDFPHGEYVPVSGSGKRLLLHGFSRIYAVERR